MRMFPFSSNKIFYTALCDSFRITYSIFSDRFTALTRLWPYNFLFEYYTNIWIS